MPLADFVLGSRTTAREPDQLMTAVLVPKPSERRAYGHFLKLGARKYLVISIAMVAAMVEVDADGRVTSAGIAVGACSPVAQRLPALERALLGRAYDGALGQAATPEQLAPLSPIDDVRGSARYRLDATLTLVQRTLNELGEKALSQTRSVPGAPTEAAITVRVNGRTVNVAAPPHQEARGCPTRRPQFDGHENRMQRRRLRCLHGAPRR